jgi:hypothetical protein
VLGGVQGKLAPLVALARDPGPHLRAVTSGSYEGRALFLLAARPGKLAAESMSTAPCRATKEKTRAWAAALSGRARVWALALVTAICIAAPATVAQARALGTAAAPENSPLGLARNSVTVGVRADPLQAQKTPLESAFAYGDLASDGPYATRGGLAGAETWGRAETLADHFARHGADVGGKTAEHYAESASNLLLRSQAEGLPTKIDSSGIIRVYDPATNTFGAFNPDGTTRTIFSPTRGAAYFEGQPGAFPWTP